jgi:DNA-binding IscR family transcriptional regulator
MTRGAGIGSPLGQPQESLWAAPPFRLPAPAAPPTCQDCGDVKAYVVRLTMAKVRDAMADILDRLTLADMLALDDGSRRALAYHI